MSGQEPARFPVIFLTVGEIQRLTGNIVDATTPTAAAPAPASVTTSVTTSPTASRFQPYNNNNRHRRHRRLRRIPITIQEEDDEDVEPVQEPAREPAREPLQWVEDIEVIYDDSGDEVEPAPQVNWQIESESEADWELEPDVESEDEAEDEAQAQAESEDEAEPEAQAESEDELELEPEAQVDAEAEEGFEVMDDGYEQFRQYSIEKNKISQKEVNLILKHYVNKQVTPCSKNPSLEDECSICQEKFFNSSKYYAKVDCGHWFHWRCLRKQVKINRACALCRANLDHREGIVADAPVVIEDADEAPAPAEAELLLIPQVQH